MVMKRLRSGEERVIDRSMEFSTYHRISAGDPGLLGALQWLYSQVYCLRSFTWRIKLLERRFCEKPKGIRYISE
jgi:hypothetical protein